MKAQQTRAISASVKWQKATRLKRTRCKPTDVGTDVSCSNYANLLRTKYGRVL